MARFALKILAISSVLSMQGPTVSVCEGWPTQAELPSAVTQSPENIRLSDTHSEEPHIAVDSQGRVFAGWKQLTGACLGPDGFARSVDGGRTWSHQTPFGETTLSQGQSDPWLAVDEFDRVYYVRDEGYFTDADCHGRILIMLSRSDDGGLTWGPSVNVAPGEFHTDMPRIQSDGNGTMYAVYYQGGNVAVKRSTDGGATWSPERAAGSAGVPPGAVIAPRPNGKVFVAFNEGGDTMVVASSDRGETWSSPVRVNPQPGSAAASRWNYDIVTKLANPSIVADSRGDLFVAWADRATGDSDILVSRSGDDGATWSAPVRINDTLAGDQWSATLAIDVNDMLHAAWYDQRSGEINLYYANSRDGGQTWSPNLRITTQGFLVRRVGEYFGLAVDREGAAYMVWTDGRDGAYDGPWYIYFARTESLSRGPVERPRPGERKPSVLPPRN